MSIDNEQRLYEDLEVICYKESHSLIAYGVALPAIVIWGLGIPFFGFFLVFVNRRNLSRFDVKSKYGFLYNGYKQHGAYFWEFIIMYRKIVIIFISVFMA